MKVKAKNILKQKYLMKHALEKNKDNKTDIIPNENTKYNYRVLLQIHSMKDNDDIKYYPQVLIEQCGYRPFFNNTIILQIFFCRF